MPEDVKMWFCNNDNVIYMHMNVLYAQLKGIPLYHYYTRKLSPFQFLYLSMSCLSYIHMYKFIQKKNVTYIACHSLLTASLTNVSPARNGSPPGSVFELLTVAAVLNAELDTNERNEVDRVSVFDFVVETRYCDN